MNEPLTSNEKAAQLRDLRVRLKSGEYSGTDIMQAWLVLDEYATALERAADAPSAGSCECNDDFAEHGHAADCPKRPSAAPRDEFADALFDELHKRDAERYRWLRSHIAPSILSRLTGTPRSMIADQRPEALDKWLDTRLSEKKEAACTCPDSHPITRGHLESCPRKLRPSADRGLRR